MRIIVILFPIFLFYNCHQDKQTGGKISMPHQIRYFKIPNPALISPPETVFDTFTRWKQLIGYFHLRDSVSEEELKDRLELVSGALQKIKQQAFPPRLNKVEIKSRLLLLENETHQLKWVLKNNYKHPDPDSLFVRWLQAYSGLSKQIDLQTGENENFEEIFKAKKERDSLLEERFNKNFSDLTTTNKKSQ